MSDALTDIARDQERGKFYEVYLSKLINYLKSKSEEDYKSLEEAAEDVDSVRRGYWTSETNLSKNLRDLTEKLIEKDKITWAKLLMCINQHDEQCGDLRKLSPFKNKILVFVDYGRGFVNIKGLENIIYKKLEKEDYKAYDCDEYVIVLPISEKDFDKSKVVWIKCGAYGIKGPRNSKGEPKEKRKK